MKEVKNTIQTEPREPPIFFYGQTYQYQRSLAAESSFLPWIKRCFKFLEQDFADSDRFGGKFRCQPKLQKTQNFGSPIFSPNLQIHIFKIFFTKNRSVASVKRCFKSTPVVLYLGIKPRIYRMGGRALSQNSATSLQISCTLPTQ